MANQIFFLRHQAGGVLHKYPFTAPPTSAQKAAVWKECFQSHGEMHPKEHLNEDGVTTHKKPYWTFDDPRALVTVDVLGPNDVPAVEDRDLRKVNEAAAAAPVASGKGTVTNPK